MCLLPWPGGRPRRESGGGWAMTRSYPCAGDDMTRHLGEVSPRQWSPYSTEVGLKS